MAVFIPVRSLLLLITAKNNVWGIILLSFSDQLEDNFSAIAASPSRILD
jgi:hypothetical protein